MDISPLSSSLAPLVESISDMINEKFVIGVTNITDQATISTEDIKSQVDKCLVRLSHHPEPERFLATPVTIEKKIDAYRVLKAMYDYAILRGVEGPIRYTGASIIECKNELPQFIRLANTWVGAFMWPFKQGAVRKALDWRNGITVDPACGETKSDQVRRRDNYTCCISGKKEMHSIPPPSPSGRSWVGNTDIMTCSAASLSKKSNHHSASTMDILRAYCAVPSEVLENLTDLIDDPCNGFGLDVLCRQDFMHFYWCLIPTETENKYELVTVKYAPTYPDSRQFFTFTDNSSLHKSSSQQSLSARCGVPLPQKVFFEIHAALAHVLHLSGAGEVLELIAGTMNPEGSQVSASDPQGVDDLSAAIAVMDLNN